MVLIEGLILLNIEEYVVFIIARITLKTYYEVLEETIKNKDYFVLLVGVLVIILYRLIVLLVLVLSTLNGGYAPSSVQFDFVEKEYVTRYSDPLKIEVYLEDSGVPVEGIRVDVYILVGGSKSLLGSNTTGQNGIAIIFVSSLLFAPGSYELLAKCIYGDTQYNASSSLIIKKERTKIRVEYGDYSVEYSDVANLSCYLTTDDGEAIPNAVIRAYLGAITYESTTNENGEAILAIDTRNTSLGIGNYSIDVFYDGNTYYLPSNTSSNITIIPEEIHIIVSTVGKKNVGSSIELLVEVIDNDGSPAPLVSVKILLNGEILCLGITNEFGKYNYTWHPTKPGKYNITIEAWNKNYLNATYELILEIAEQTYTPVNEFLLLGGIFTIVFVAIIFMIRKPKYRKTTS